MAHRGTNARPTDRSERLRRATVGLLVGAAWLVGQFAVAPLIGEFAIVALAQAFILQARMAGMGADWW